jgi:hypothetical protein
MIQITFLTLFLGLAAGPRPVELAVQGPAEQIAGLELLLDGAPAGRLAGPPWRTKIDLGPGLLPHELVARAVDAEGRELARVRQWLNLPRSPAEVEIALETAPDGRPAAALLAWQSLISGLPKVLVTLDGQPLPAGTGAAVAEGRRLRVPLPEADLATAHVLSVELRFSPAVSAHRDLVFGGGGGQVSTELTAVPVKARRGKLPPPAGLQGQLLAGGRALRVVAVEDEPAQLIMVRDIGAKEALRKLRLVGGVIQEPGSRPRGSDYARYDLALERDARVRLLWPTARRTGDAGLVFELFDTSGDYTARDGGLHWLLTRVSNPEETKGEGQRFADAVAVAGLQVLAGNGPRAVLLVLGSDSPDESRYTPAQVRQYLAAIRVPLFVWSYKTPSPAVIEVWGTVKDVSSPAGLRGAVGELKRELADQQVVWVDGLHLPQSISAAPQAGLALAGAAN